jgi:hypothetical protein
VRQRAGIRGRSLAKLLLLAASAPLLWALFDLITAGSPIHSFTATRHTAEDIGRHIGPVELITYSPHQLVQAMGWWGLIGAAAGIALGLALLRRRSAPAFLAALLAGAAFGVVAGSGLAILARYMMLGSVLLCIFGAVALLGWRLLPRGDRWRVRWELIAAGLLVLLVISVPRQYADLDQVVDVLDEEKTIDSDLRHLADSGAFVDHCRSITVPGPQAVPRLAAWLDIRPSQITILADEPRPGRGYVLVPADPGVALHYGPASAPAGFGIVARNGSWRLYRRC